MTITPGMAARCRRLGEPHWTADSQAVLYLDSLDGRGDLYRAPVDGGPAVCLTAEPAPQGAASYGGGVFAVSPGGEHVVYVAKDKQLWRLPTAGGPPQQLTHGKATPSAPSFSPDGQRLASMFSDEKTQAIGVLAASGGWPQQVSADAAFHFDPSWSPDGALAWHEWDPPNMAWDGSRILMRAPDGALTVVDGADDVCTGQPRFAPTGPARLAYLCDRTGWQNLWLYDVATGERRHLVVEEAEHGRAGWAPGQQSYCWSPDGREIAFVRVANQGGGLRVVKVESGAVREIGPQGGSVGGVVWSPDGRRLAYVYSSPTEPLRLETLEIATGERRVLVHGAPAGFDAADLPEAEVLTWPTVGGETAHGWLLRPKGVENPPLLVSVHGGPTSQAERTFLPGHAYMVDRGWAVLSVNYRGSTGQGRAYAQALRGNWGIHDVDDSVSGARFVCERGWADPDRVAVMGGSAGGWTVLCCMARAGDTFKAGVNLFGVSDLVKFAPETHRFEAHYLDTLIGPLPESYDRYVERSPVNMIDQMKTPLLILQGDSDVVVPPNQSEDVYNALKDRKDVVVEMKLYPGEGHGWAKCEHTIDQLERVEKFLNHHVLHKLS